MFPSPGCDLCDPGKIKKNFRAFLLCPWEVNFVHLSVLLTVLPSSVTAALDCQTCADLQSYLSLVLYFFVETEKIWVVCFSRKWWCLIEPLPLFPRAGGSWCLSHFRLLFFKPYLPSAATPHPLGFWAVSSHSPKPAEPLKEQDWGACWAFYKIAGSYCLGSVVS